MISALHHLSKILTLSFSFMFLFSCEKNEDISYIMIEHKNGLSLQKAFCDVRSVSSMKKKINKLHKNNKSLNSFPEGAIVSFMEPTYIVYELSERMNPYSKKNVIITLDKNKKIYNLQGDAADMQALENMLSNTIDNASFTPL